MAVFPQTRSIAEAPFRRPAPRNRPNPSQRPPAPSAKPVARRRAHEPQLGLLLRRAAIAVIPAACVLTAVYGRMQLLEASMQRFHLNKSVGQELSKKQVLMSAMNNVVRQDQTDEYAQAHGLAMQSAPPIFVEGRQKGR